MNRIYLLLVSLFALSCSQLKVDPDCYPNNRVEHEAKGWQGRVIYFEELGQWTIRYHVPGTIDTSYTGVVCDMPVEYQTDQLQVIYSGYLKDDKEKIKPNTVLGGEEFYFLELLTIIEAE